MTAKQAESLSRAAMEGKGILCVAKTGMAGMPEVRFPDGHTIYAYPQDLMPVTEGGAVMSDRKKGPLTRHEAMTILACDGGVEVWSAEMARTIRRIAKARPGLLELEEVGKDHPGFAGRRARPVLLVRATATGNQQSCAALRRGMNRPRLLSRRIA